MPDKKKLMVIIPDRLSDLIIKGEVTERYYNPGDLFEEVHIVMTNDDHPDIGVLQKTVGSAELHLHNIPATRILFALTLGWRPWLLGCWTRKLVKLAKTIHPALIRCHGAHLNTFAASRIKAVLGIPYVVSLHTNPDKDIRGRTQGWLKTFVTTMQKDIERIGLENADYVMPVYQSIVSFLDILGIQNYEICYNVLNPSIQKKNSYRLHSPVRIISTGRQIDGKNPDNLIRAISELPNISLTLVGDGDYHDYLHQVALDCGVSGKVEFIRALPNDELCRRLPKFDIFAIHCNYCGLPKTVLEAFLSGLPVVVNRLEKGSVSELTEDICMLVDNTVEGYHSALERLIEDAEYREQLGRSAYYHAQAHWAPAKTETKFVEIYRRIMREKNT